MRIWICEQYILDGYDELKCLVPKKELYLPNGRVDYRLAQLKFYTATGALMAG